MNYCNIQIGGRLTRDIEVRTTQGGTCIASFAVAVNTGKGDKAKASFFDVKAFGEYVAKWPEWAKKGDPVFVSGRMEMETWEKDGQKRTKWELLAYQVHFLKHREKEEEPPLVKEIPF